jgi:isoamylase
MRPRRDLPPPLGATLHHDGVDFAFYAGHADGVEVVLFDRDAPADDPGRAVRLEERAHGTWFGFVPGIGAGQRYALRVRGPWRPAEGMRHNPDKLLLDPYARAIEGDVTWGPEVFGHWVDAQLRGDPDVRDGRDSAPYMPRCVVVDDTYDWGDDAPPLVPWTETVVYETHVRNLTRRHPDVPEELRGTYAGLAHPATLRHLTGLGVTSVELLPVQAFTSEPALVQRGLANHWGYNTLGFFAPHAPYAAAAGPQGALEEFKDMVKALHREGLEVILDVVYNHTAEQGRDGATLSWRGLDNRAYYRLDERGQDIDVTGCGNTLDLRHPVVCRMVLDSLRYWVGECHVDGFRFDLAVALGRGRDDGYDPDHPFLVALRTDPVLSRVKLIAEPWDVGVHGWRTGQFPPPFSEWNDRFRDAVRSFWLPDVARSAHGQPGHGVRELGTRFAGSQDLFGARDRGPIASVNYVAAHDGFTLADTTAYERKHNGANGEGNRDGHGDNRSWNHGVEGALADEDVLRARRRSVRNLLGTLLLATGVPMLNGGDELGRTQRGNNNAFCQDNDVSWLDWDLDEQRADLLETTRHLTRLRAAHPVLRRRSFFTGRPSRDGGGPDLQWFAADGQPMHNGRWDDPHTRTLAMYLDGSAQDATSLYLVLNGEAVDAKVTLPALGWVAAFELLWDSTDERPLPGASPVRPGTTTRMTAASLRVYAARR